MSSDLPTRAYRDAHLAKGWTCKAVFRALERAVTARSFTPLAGHHAMPDYSDLRPARRAKNLSLVRPARTGELELGRRPNDELAARSRSWLTAAGGLTGKRSTGPHSGREPYTLGRFALMTERATKYTLLGTFVDRAISMPYAKPQEVRGGKIGPRDDPQEITDAAEEAAVFLGKALRDTTPDDQWSAARLVADSAGPWWCKATDQFEDLTPRDKQWVLNRLSLATRRGAHRLQQAAVSESWSWLWSQPALATPGRRGPVIQRPDLVAGLSGKKCLAIDFKTTTKSLDTVSLTEVEACTEWVDRLAANGFDAIACWVLAISTVPAAEEESRWIKCDPPGETVGDG